MHFSLPALSLSYPERSGALLQAEGGASASDSGSAPGVPSASRLPLPSPPTVLLPPVPGKERSHRCWWVRERSVPVEGDLAQPL